MDNINGMIQETKWFSVDVSVINETNDWAILARPIELNNNQQFVYQLFADITNMLEQTYIAARQCSLTTIWTMTLYLVEHIFYVAKGDIRVNYIGISTRVNGDSVIDYFTICFGQLSSSSIPIYYQNYSQEVQDHKKRILCNHILDRLKRFNLSTDTFYFLNRINTELWRVENQGEGFNPRYSRQVNVTGWNRKLKFTFNEVAHLCTMGGPLTIDIHNGYVYPSINGWSTNNPEDFSTYMLMRVFDVEP